MKKYFDEYEKHYARHFDVPEELVPTLKERVLNEKTGVYQGTGNLIENHSSKEKNLKRIHAKTSLITIYTD